MTVDAVLYFRSHDYSPIMDNNYDFFLRIGVDGKREVGKSGLIRKFAQKDFIDERYDETLH
ncbi:12364_t:CDS:2, partial [Cetraspora pellucida]